MDKGFIIKLLRSDNQSDRVMALSMLMEGKEEKLSGDFTMQLENGFTIDNSIEDIDGLLYNDIKIHFIGKQILSELFMSSLVYKEDI